MCGFDLEILQENTEIESLSSDKHPGLSERPITLKGGLMREVHVKLKQSIINPKEDNYGV